VVGLIRTPTTGADSLSIAYPRRRERREKKSSPARPLVWCEAGAGGLSAVAGEDSRCWKTSSAQSWAGTMCCSRRRRARPSSAAQNWAGTAACRGRLRGARPSSAEQIWTGTACRGRRRGARSSSAERARRRPAPTSCSPQARRSKAAT
jgi:hypothetical protein